MNPLNLPPAAGRGACESWPKIARPVTADAEKCCGDGLCACNPSTCWCGCPGCVC